MRTTRVAVVAAGVTLGLAACTSGGGSATSGASGSAAPTAGASGAGGAMANSCVVGDWKSSGVDMSFAAGDARGSATGGGGLLLKIGRDGTTAIDFTAMQPITFNTTVKGTEVKGSFGYGGTASGAVTVDDPNATKGTWHPVGTSDWQNTTLTVELTSPIQSKIFDHAKISDFAGGNDQTGGAVDVQPILKDGTYRCGAGTLTIGPPPGTTTGGTWVLGRA